MREDRGNHGNYEPRDEWKQGQNMTQHIIGSPRGLTCHVRTGHTRARQGDVLLITAGLIGLPAPRRVSIAAAHGWGAGRRDVVPGSVDIDTFPKVAELRCNIFTV